MATIAAVKPKNIKKRMSEIQTISSKDNKDIYVGEFLKRKRKEYGLKLGEVAEFLDVATYTYMSYEAKKDASNYRLPTISILVNLARLYNCTLDEILGEQAEREIVEFKYINQA